jgi:hypothetical protein
MKNKIHFSILGDGAEILNLKLAQATIKCTGGLNHIYQINFFSQSLLNDQDFADYTTCSGGDKCVKLILRHKCYECANFRMLSRCGERPKMVRYWRSNEHNILQLGSSRRNTTIHRCYQLYDHYCYGEPTLPS